MPIKKHCQTCGKEFLVPPVRKDAKYCCHPCSVKRGSEHVSWNKELVSCEECGKMFHIKPSQKNKNKHSYCSRKCNGIAQGKIVSEKSIKKRIIKKCVVCSSEISVKPSHKDIEGTYCSKECMSVDYKTRLLKNNNPNFSHGKAHIAGHYQRERRFAIGAYDKSYPEKLYYLQKGRCACCENKLNGKYQVDHIFPIARGGTNYKENLQLLCKSCNCRKHAIDPFVFANKNGKLL